jgi:aerobic carbon-monoxide dehydrogenase large subunit
MIDQSLRFGKNPTGQRREDRSLLTGQGNFTDDIACPGQLHAAFVRSPHAHARISRIDVSAALGASGVVDVFSGDALVAAGVGHIPMAMRFNNSDGSLMALAPVPVLPHDRVRYVGEAIAIVIAETVAEAHDAAEMVVIEFDELPAYPTVETAVAGGAAIWDEAPGNVALDWEDGNRAAVEAAFSSADHVVSVSLQNTRLAPSALEPRAAIAEWDIATERYKLIAGTQGVALIRKVFAEHVFKITLDQIRVLPPDVGGGFGMKVQPYAEYAALLFAARQMQKPVRWVASRVESFLTDTHGRDGVLKAELALDRDGNFLALRADNLVGIGAYVSTFAPVFSTNNTKNCLASVYKTPLIHIRVRAILTNAVPVGPYRGAGRPEAIYLIERLIEKASKATKIDSVTLRRRNMIPSTAMPYAAPNGQVYDSGEFEIIMDKALALADWTGFEERRKTARQQGRLRGIGICCFLEVAGGILDESADLRFAPDGTVALRLGVQAIGQGHQTTFTYLVADLLGINPDNVQLIEGDSDQSPKGWPTVASRSAMMAGGATFNACEEVIRKGHLLAGEVLETAAQDINFSNGDFVVSGTDRRISLAEVARRARQMENLPEGYENGLDSTMEFASAEMTFPNGCHICEVEIDTETGNVSVVRYVAVDDVGVILNEPIVDGQIHGGIAQGLGQVLGERVVYDENGQLRTASFMDYPMPRADDLPELTIAHHVVPSTTNPLGVKGAGESGVAGSLPSAMNAVLHALGQVGIDDFDLPASPERVWLALECRRDLR